MKKLKWRLCYSSGESANQGQALQEYQAQNTYTQRVVKTIGQFTS